MTFLINYIVWFKYLLLYLLMTTINLW